MTRTLLPILLLAPIVSCTSAQQPPEAIMESCLLFDRATDPSILISPISGRAQVMEQGGPAPYRLFLPDGDNKAMRVGYASGKGKEGDYIFVNAHRGYIDRAAAAGFFSPRRLESPRQASFALLRQRGTRYVCVMEGRGRGGSTILRSAFVARIPPKMGGELILYYRLQDMRQLARNGP
ncbi:hypothetical protein G5B88_13480 [Herbaspirillum seropedicae]|uniref:hypothetical protein n=1 Tax=Herbaspirillum TaxID=963 RepID=UPI0002FB75C3|nr:MULTISPECIES: hypothetical protein [Herbaspirillum]AON54994.1 hypothetical protein Hsc_2712 [Herbaspirillum seropedicae]MDR6393953.1 hypothetical protein [Herbaspirillum seropedicae]NQE30799.1 hypothetical protein [Herbaspirillum seropedicae]UMU22102.1 hypothetical protein G5B88_13480 [Herbaspirillum seropedicae]